MSASIPTLLKIIVTGWLLAKLTELPQIIRNMAQNLYQQIMPSTLITNNSPLATLPSDIHLMILERLQPLAFNNYLYANYHIIRNSGLTPYLSTRELSLYLRPRRIIYPHRLWHLPTELLDEIFEMLSPADRIACWMAWYHLLRNRGVVPFVGWKCSGGLRQHVVDAAKEAGINGDEYMEDGVAVELTMRCEVLKARDSVVVVQ